MLCYRNGTKSLLNKNNTDMFSASISFCLIRVGRCNSIEIYRTFTIIMNMRIGCFKCASSFLDSLATSRARGRDGEEELKPKSLRAVIVSPNPQLPSRVTRDFIEGGGADL